MKDINKRLSYCLKWLSFESLLYHAIFIVHQVFLCKVSGYKIYGTIGALFSIIYLIVTVACLGLESSLSPFFKVITTNQKQCKHFIIIQLIPTIILSIASFPLLLFLKNIQNYVFLQSLDYRLIGILSFLILSESIKKILRGILYMAFKNKTNMVIEISSLLLYILSVWLGYFALKKITLALIFIPMTIISILSTLVLLSHVYFFYQGLPQNLVKTENYPTYFRIFKIRIINFINQFTHNMFSSNFLVPFFAIQFGLAQAGIFKLLSHITYTVTMLMRKIFGWSTDVLLSQTKNLTITCKQNIFHVITQKMNTIIVALVIFLSINLTKIIQYTNTSSSALNWSLIYFFLAITLTENFFISYEKFYIAEEKNSIILAINLLSIAILSTTIIYADFLSQTMLFFLIILARTTCFALLALISFCKWHIRPQARIKPFYIAISFAISIVFFTLF